MRITGLLSSSGVEAQTSSIEKSHLKILLNRKQDILYQKQNYADASLKQGKSQQDIRDKMKEYDGLILEIEQEISKIVSSQKRQALDDEKNAVLSRGNSAAFTEKAVKQKKSVAQNVLASLSPLQSNGQMIRSVLLAQRILKASSNQVFSGNSGQNLLPGKRAAQTGKNAEFPGSGSASAASGFTLQSPNSIEHADYSYRQMVIEQYHKVSNSLNIYQYITPSQYDTTI